MKFYWVRYRVIQGHYLVYWVILKENLDDYFTKHHPTKHHRSARVTYLVPTVSSIMHSFYQVPSNLQGYVKSPPDQETGD